MNSAGVAEMLKLPQWFSCYTHMTALSGLDSGAGRVMSGGVVHFWTQVTPNVKHKKKTNNKSARDMPVRHLCLICHTI